MINPLYYVYTIREASDRFGIPVQTLKSACAGQKGLPPRFKTTEARKSGGTWLVTRAGLARVYGIKE